jgi:hypothetical protein
MDTPVSALYQWAISLFVLLSVGASGGYHAAESDYEIKVS